MMSNIHSYFTKNRANYKIIIAEQYNDCKFNRGLLLNTAFKIARDLEIPGAKYVHFNIDYEFNLDFEFPKEFAEFTTGILDLFRPPCPVIGSACIFDADSYLKCNGFPNDIHGWGGDDWALHYRVVQKEVPVHITRLFNSGLVIEYDRHEHMRDASSNDSNIELANRYDMDTNGVSTCVFDIAGNGEFHNNETVLHYFITSPLFSD
jgi:hypothetical protein